ncbi:MAG: hypothetical protein RLZZ65_1048 [Bacteroidota bacterium]|jgi:hypothetical protein
MQIVPETPAIKRNFEQNVASVSNLGFFEQVWVQDTLHTNWVYLINQNQEILLRLPLTKKWGLRAYLQPLFLREFSIRHISNADFKALLQFLHGRAFVHLNFSLKRANNSSEVLSVGQGATLKTGTFQILEWTQGIDQIRTVYSENVRRNLKKSKGLSLQNISYAQFESFFTQEKGVNLGKLNRAAWQRLATLTALAQEKNQSFIGGVYDQDALVAVGLFFSYNGQLYFMKGTVNEAGKKKSALIFLIDTVLEKFADAHQSLDFVGSNQESIAAFYRKFGAKDAQYSIVKGRFPLV